MGSNQYYKNKALGSLEGNWGTAAIATLIIALISGGVSSVVSLPFGNDFTIGMSINSIWSLLCLPLQWGYTVFFLNLLRREDFNYERLFDGYKDFARTFLLEFLYVIAMMIGFCLFIIPGIIILTILGVLEELGDDQRSQDEIVLVGPQLHWLDDPQYHDPRYRFLLPGSLHGYHFCPLLRRY